MKRCLVCGETFSSSSWTCPECASSPGGDGIPEFAPELASSDEHYPPGTFARLASLEGRHFWFTARSELIVWLLRRHLPRARTLLEVGCGTGGVLARIAAARPEIDLTGGDLLREALDVARTRVPQATLLQLDLRRIPYTEEFDVVCALDVLEHIDEDALALAEIRRTLRPGGSVLITVPQHPRLWSAADEFARHRRRYTRRALLGRLEEAGFATVRATSSVSLLLPFVLASRAANRHLTDDYDPFRELTLPRIVNRAFGTVMHGERALIRAGVPLPFGSSLVAVARRR